MRVDTEVFFEAFSAFVDGSSSIDTEVTYVPGFIFVAGNAYFVGRVSDNEAVFVSVFNEPGVFRSISEGVVDGVKVDSKTCLMFGVTGASRESVGRFLTVVGNIVVVDTFLS